MNNLYEQGSKDNLVVTIEEATGADLTGVAVELSISPVPQAGEWVAITDLDYSTPGTIRATLLNVATRLNGGPTTYHVFARVTDNPEQVILYAGIFRVR